MMTLDDLTLIVPFRIESQDRRQNLADCVRFFAQTGAQFLLCHGVGPGDDPLRGGAGSIELPEKSRHLAIDNPRPEPFYKTRIINRGLREVQTRYFGILDCDTLCHHGQVREAVRTLREGLADFVYPYDGRFVEVPRSLVPDFLTGQLQGKPDFAMLHVNSCGGLIMGYTEAYRTAGGENEHFISWGPEDMERHNRLLKLGYRVARVDGPIFHMEHARGPDSSSSNPYMQANLQEFDRIDSMDTKGLLQEVASWPWRKDLWRQIA